MQGGHFEYAFYKKALSLFFKNHEEHFRLIISSKGMLISRNGMQNSLHSTSINEDFTFQLITRLNPLK